jgi:hypothetical protein
MVAWADVDGRLAAATIYWLATTRSDGRPHTVPLWGVWDRGLLYFDGGPQTAHARNLTANPQAAMHLESGTKVVILEGEVAPVSQVGFELSARLAAAYRGKYASQGYSPEPSQWDNGGLYRLQPVRALAWTDFPKDVTRFVLTGPDFAHLDPNAVD